MKAGRRPASKPPDPPRAQLLKKDPATSSAGTPPAGHSSISEALDRGPIGALQILGPGLITGASDDDPSGIATYSQVGSQFGYGLLWTALFTFPLMSSVQELCARIALETGEGLGSALRRRFPAGVVGAAVLALLIANTINIGADLSAVAAGVNLLAGGRLPALALVVVTAVAVMALQLFWPYARIVSVFKWLTLALFAYVVTAFLSHPNAAEVVAHTFVPHIELSGDFIAALVAVLGTTISPYLFFWQASSEVDELEAAGPARFRHRHGVKNRELVAARLDVLVGMGFSQLVMYCIVLTAAATLNAHGHTQVQTAQDAASALAPLAGGAAFVIFGVGLIGTGLLAIPVLSSSAAYAMKEFLGIRGSLAVKPQHRRAFYAIIVAATVAGVLLNVAGLDPIRALFITAVINGLVAGPLLVLIIVLGSDARIMGRRVSKRFSRTLTWLTAALMGASAIALVVTMVHR